MKSYPTKNATKTVSEIVSLLSDLHAKVALDDSLTYLPEQELQEIVHGVKSILDTYYKHHEFSEVSRLRLEDLTEIMTRIADLDFTQKAKVADKPENHFDFMGIGLNLMSHQLEKSMEERLKYQFALDSLDRPILITDVHGKIQFSNRIFNKISNVSSSRLLQKTIQEILNENNWFEGYSVNISLNESSKAIKYNVISDPLYSEILNTKDEYIGRVYSFQLIPASEKKQNAETKELQQNLHQLIDEFTSKVDTEIDKGLSNTSGKDNVLREIMETLEDKGQFDVSRLTPLEQSWLGAIKNVLN